MNRRAAAVLIGLAVGPTGCKLPPKADAPLSACWVDSYQPPSPVAVPQDGVYHLKAAGPGGRLEPTPAMTTQLRQKDPVGFRRDETGQMVAFAGDNDVPLSAGRYAWVLDRQSELHGPRLWKWWGNEALEATGRGMMWMAGLMLTAAVDKLLGSGEPSSN